MRGVKAEFSESIEAFDDAEPRRLRRVSLSDTSIEMEVMIHRGEKSDLRPLVIINSIEFPVPPSTEFCEKMWAAGYQVIFCRRPGFGGTAGLPDVLLAKEHVKNGAAIATEAALFTRLIDTLELDDVLLIGLGTSNSICYRLGQLSSKVSFTVYANPLNHPSIWDVIRPDWLRRMIRQTLLSKGGLKIAVRGLKAVLRRDTLWFYRQFAQKSAGDVAYVTKHKADFDEAGLALQWISPKTFYYDLQTSLIEDTEWDPGVTKRSNAVMLAGVETIDHFKKEIKAEADRLGLPIVFAASGDLFVPYASPDELLSLFKEHVAREAKEVVI